jgi:hypothetical protein
MRCASQQTRAVDVSVGSTSTLLAEAMRPFMSAMPPIPTELMRHNKTSQDANQRDATRAWARDGSPNLANGLLNPTAYSKICREGELYELPIGIK